MPTELDAVAPLEDDARPLAVDDVEIAAFDGEIVVLHVPTRMVHRLVGVAAGAWLLADGDTTVGAMRTELAEAFATTEEALAPLLSTALADLTAAGLFHGAPAVDTQAEVVDTWFEDDDGNRIEVPETDERFVLPPPEP